MPSIGKVLFASRLAGYRRMLDVDLYIQLKRYLYVDKRSKNFISDLCCAESISQAQFPSGREKYLVCVFCWWWLLCICWYLDEYVCSRVDCRGTQAFFAYSVYYMHFSRCGGVRTIESGEKQAQSSIGGCSLNGISHRPKPHIYPDSEFVLWPQKSYNWAFHHLAFHWGIRVLVG